MAFLQLISIGRFDEELNNFHRLTHISNSIDPIKLNKIFSTISFNSNTDLIEHVFLLFPEKYNEFCNHPDYPLNCVKSVTIEIKSEITDNIYKVVYYPPSKCVPTNEDYNTLTYKVIDDSILMPQSSSKNEELNVYYCSFFQKQRVIICPLKIKSASLRVSIQRHEETLLLKDETNKFTDLLPDTITEQVALLVSDPIYLKPLPSVYIGRTILNINDKIPDNLFIPKHESLDVVSGGEEKSWSEYKEFKKSNLEQVNKESYLYSLQNHNQRSSYLFFIHKKDLLNIKNINFIMDGNIISCIPRLWLQTRYKEYIDNNENKTQLDDNYILLPLPLLYFNNTHLAFNIKVNNILLDPPVLFFKSKVDMENKFILKNINTSGILQIQNQQVNYNNYEKSEIELKFKHLLFGIWGVVTYKDIICSASSPHPFSKLKISMENVILSEENGDYYNKVVPLYFEQSPSTKYLIYRMMFQNTPLSFSHPVNKDPYEPAHFISNEFYYSTLNAGTLMNKKMEIFWDEKVIQQHYPEKDQLKIHFFGESYNLLLSMIGNSRLRYF